MGSIGLVVGGGKGDRVTRGILKGYLNFFRSYECEVSFGVLVEWLVLF